MRSATLLIFALLALFFAADASTDTGVNTVFGKLNKAKGVADAANNGRAATKVPESGTTDHESDPSDDESLGSRARNMAKAKNLGDVEDELPSLSYNTAMKKINLARTESALIALFLVGIGVVLCFAGKVFFKVFLGLVGFVLGGLIGLRMLGIAAHFDILPEEHAKMTAYVCVLVSGIVCGSACLCLFKWGVFVAAATAGYFGTTVFIALPFMEPVVDAVNNNTLLVVGVIIALIAAWFFNNIIVIFASSIIGAFMAVVGADMILCTGFKEDMYNMAIERDPSIPTDDDPAYMLYSAFTALVVLGIVAQFLFMRSQRQG